jgi:crotonobetaine/carnitine-CoA ligase
MTYRAQRTVGGPTDRWYEGEWIVSSLLIDRAERFGDGIAVSSQRGDVSWSGLVEGAERFAGFLESIGVEPGDRVATLLPSTVDYMAAWHGIVWRNAIDVPINNEYKGMFLEHMLRDSGAKAIILDARWVDRLNHIELPADLEHVIVWGEGDVAVPGGLVTHDFSAALESDPGSLVPRTETDLTYIMYTSGTTGPAKGVVHNNRSSIWYTMPFVEGLDITDDDICYSMFPLFHQMGRSACSTAAWFCGNRVVLRESFSASGFWEDIAESKATWMGYFGAVVLFLWNQDPAAADTSHSMRRAFGSSAPRELIGPWQERFGVKLHEAYGSTELGLGSGLGPGYGQMKLGTMGPICHQVEARIVDENDEPLPAGEIGEAVWRPTYPYAIFQGYWNDPQSTVDAWENLWFHSGDAATMDEAGNFIFKDRIKDSIRRRGENISSFAVEESVRGLPGVLEVAAFAVKHEQADTEEEVAIAVVPRADGGPDPRELFQALCEAMPRHAVPRYLRIMDEFPKTPTQRVQKVKLRDAGVTPDMFDREAMGIFPPPI